MIRVEQYLAALNAAGMRLFDAPIAGAMHQDMLAQAVDSKVLIKRKL